MHQMVSSILSCAVAGNSYVILSLISYHVLQRSNNLLRACRSSASIGLSDAPMTLPTTGLVTVFPFHLGTVEAQKLEAQ